MAFGRKPAPVCRRSSDRETVMLAGAAMAVARSRSVVVSDLSSDGAALAGRDLPPPGDDLILVVGTLDRMGTVIWRFGDKCGVRFDEPLAVDNVSQMKREAAWASVTGWAR